MKIEKWLGYKFESSSGLTPEFSQFARDFKKAIILQLPEASTLVSFNRGHFYAFGFIKSSDGEYVYFNTPDVRYNKDSWYSGILIRTAKSDKDFTGGRNCFTDFKNFKTDVAKLLEKGA